MEADILQIESPSSTLNMDPIIEEVQQFLNKQLGENDLSYTTLLLISEAVANGMEHGNKYDESKQIRLRVRVNDDKVIVDVQDEGDGFDRQDIADPLTDDNLLATGGRGIFLIESMAHSVEYFDQGQRVRFEMLR